MVSYLLCDMYNFGLVSFLVLTIGYSYALSVDENQILPPMYQMDDYRLCQSENGLYCKLIFQVLPEKSDNIVWKMIEKSKENPYTFHRDTFYRYRCIRNNLAQNEEIKRMVTNQENANLKNISLSAQITYINCRKFERIPLTIDDKIFLYVLISYLTLVLAATFYHIRMQKHKQNPIRKVNEYFLCFSLKRNWDKFLQLTDYPDYTRLKSFQGLKVLCMLTVISGHVMMSIITLSTTNPEFFETVYMNPIFRYVINFGMNSVQIYFLISGWILANGIFSTYFSEKRLRVRRYLIDIMIRYGRLIGPLALCVMFSRTTLYTFFERGPQGGHIHVNYETCKRNGWATLIFVNNFFPFNEQCYLIAWYVSADFQLFLSALGLVYITVKYGLTERQLFRIVSAIIGITWIYNTFVIYFNRFPVSVGTSPEKSKLETSLSSYETYAMHTSMFINTGGYYVGLIAGALYFKLKDKDVSDTIGKWLLKLGLITPFMIFLSVFDYSPLLNGIIGASLKPMYNVGIACFVFGLLFTKENGICKRIFEWNKFEYLTKLTYSIYLSHYWMTFGQEILFDKMIEMSYLRIVVTYLISTILSIFLGLVVFILFENPIRGLLSVSMKKSSQDKTKTT